MGKKIVLGVGNLLLRDEGVGVHVVRALAERPLPSGVEVIDGGTAGADLLPYLTGAEKIIVVDAIRGGEEPGAVYRLKPEDCFPMRSAVSMSLHEFGVLDTINTLKILEGKTPDVVIIGVEPKVVDWGTELTPEVGASVCRVLELIEEELKQRNV